MFDGSEPTYLQSLEEHEDRLFTKLHAVVLDDDGTPQLIKKMRLMHFDSKAFMDEKYNAPKILSKLRDSFATQMAQYKDNVATRMSKRMESDLYKRYGEETAEVQESEKSSLPDTDKDKKQKELPQATNALLDLFRPKK